MSEREKVPWLEEVENGGYTWETELTDKDGGIEASETFVFFDGSASLLIEDGECGED